MAMHNPAFPGEIIGEILEDGGVSLRQFAIAMDIAPSTASRILNGKVSITPEMALKLSVALGSTAETWLNIQSAYSLALARKNTDVSHVHRIAFA